ncbi:MAG: hypothetical protein HYX67_01380 [Candidatus Melainabacteria bacterium]|nr:hypothetical protein [Candidatus Melainabacteria bacterium]
MDQIKQFLFWRKTGLNDRDGIVVACDLSQEWLLPWWWEHYSVYNSHPVAFVDLGMSETMRQWCKERGDYIFLPVADIFVEALDPSLVKKMESEFGSEFWPSRNAWFKKPLACLQSPFKRSIWLDLDCAVLGPLDALFELCDEGFAAAVEQAYFEPGKIDFNTGVMVFKRGLTLIETWAEWSVERNRQFRGDQDVLATLLTEQKLPVVEIPACYNWSRTRECTPQTVVLHYHGILGKKAIQHQLLRTSLNALFPT